MAGSRLFDRVTDRRALRRWTRTAREADVLSIDDLRRAGSRARALQSQLSSVLAASEERLALPFSGRGAIRDAADAEWSWRPDLWRGPAFPRGRARVASGATFGETVKVFHDCPLAENTIRQDRNTQNADLAPFGVRMDIFGFQGSFVSFVVDLPQEALTGLTRRHLIRISASVSAETLLRAYVRLNLKHGPNTEQMVQDLDLGQNVRAEFDLGFAHFNEARVEGVWAEILFENPGMNQIRVRDLTASRRPRAEL